MHLLGQSRYNKDIQAAKIYRKYIDRLWIRTCLFVQYEMFKVARLYVGDILATAKSQYCNNKIKECKGDQKTVFSAVSKVLHRNHTVKPIIIYCAKNVAHDFTNFFHEKIMTIHNGFPSTSPSTDILSVEESCTSIMDTFDPDSAREIKQLL